MHSLLAEFRDQKQGSRLSGIPEEEEPGGRSDAPTTRLIGNRINFCPSSVEAFVPRERSRVGRKTILALGRQEMWTYHEPRIQTGDRKKNEKSPPASPGDCLREEKNHLPSLKGSQKRIVLLGEV